MALEQAPRLGCGRSIDQIWAGMDQPQTAHEESCEQCQAARARLQKLMEATRALRESDLQDPGMQLSRGLTNAVMDVARAEARRSKRLVLQGTEYGTIEISEQALSSLIRSAATAIPGIHSRRCRIEVRASAATEGTELTINLRVATAAGIDIPGTVEALRQAIGNIIQTGVGIDAGAINITVEDLYDV